MHTLYTTLNKLLALILLLPVVFKSQNNIERSSSSRYYPETGINYTWSALEGAWVVNDTTFFLYNINGLILAETRKGQQFTSRILTTYDAAGRLKERLSQQFDQFMNGWRNLERKTAGYNAKGVVTSSTTESWNSSSNQWVVNTGSRNVVTYNVHEKVSQNTTESLDPWANSYSPQKRQMNYIYDMGNNITQIDYQNYSWSWENTNRLLVKYDDSVNPSEWTIMDWNGSTFYNSARFANVTWNSWCQANSNLDYEGMTISAWTEPGCNKNKINSFTYQIYAGGWQNSMRVKANYDNNGGSSFEYENFDGSTWTRTNRLTTMYDDKHNYTGERGELWDDNTKTWKIITENSMVHTYDAGWNITQTVFKVYDQFTNGLKNQSKTVYKDYLLIVGEDEKTADLLVSSSVFPNPANDNVTIKIAPRSSSKFFDTEARIDVRDISGKVLMSAPVTGNENNLNTAELAPGIYFYTVGNNSEIFSKGKLIIE